MIVPTDQGFTILELVLVLVVAGIIVAFLITWLDKTICRRGQARQLVADLSFGQSETISQHAYYRVNLVSGSYSISNLAGWALARPATNTSLATLAPGITMTYTNIPNDLMTFDVDEVPNTDSSEPGTAFEQCRNLFVCGRRGRSSHHYTRDP